MLRVLLTPSRYLAVLLGMAHAGAAAVIVSLDITLAAKAALEALVVASAYWSAWQGAMLRSARSIVSLEIDGERRVNVLSRRSGWQQAQLLDTSYVSPLFTILNLKLPGELRRRHVVILPDSLPQEDFRRLRVLLRWSRPAADAGP